MDVCDVVPFLRIASDTRGANGDEQCRHDERREHDDVKVGDEINCSLESREKYCEQGVRILMGISVH